MTALLWRIVPATPILAPGKPSVKLAYEPPLRWVAGVDGIAATEQKTTDLPAQADAYRGLSSSVAHDDVPAAV